MSLLPETAAPILAPVSRRQQGEALVACLGCFGLVALPGLPGGRVFALSFLSLTVGALPFVLLGALITLFLAGAVGLVLPVCECAIVVRRLLRKGMPLSAAIAYLLAGARVNSIVLLPTLCGATSLTGQSSRLCPALAERCWLTHRRSPARAPPGATPSV